MLEKVIFNRRVIFKPGQQTQFLLSAKEQLGINWSEFARQINAHPRVLNDWKREAYSLPKTTADIITALSGVKLPNGVQIKEPYWYASSSGRIGGEHTYKKYGRVGGEPEHRKEKWREWWKENDHKNNLGQYSSEKEINLPAPSEQLAELVGIILGDGGMTERQVTITLDSETDAEYTPYVVTLFKDLFGIPPRIYQKKNARAANITVSRTALVSFLKGMGLHTGNKVQQQIGIPSWIRANAAFSRACLRGLMDTDGCIFMERHLIKGKAYEYPRLRFVNRSKPLITGTYEILKNEGFSPKIRGESALTLETRTDVIRYFSHIGTRNPKHAARFAEFTGGVA